MTQTVVVDCDAGRRMGCASFCCRLIVRLAPGERDPGGNHHPRKHCVDKDPKDGLCVYFDRQTGRCNVWAQRPQTCRQYDCNADPLLQVVIRDGYTSLVRLIAAAKPGPEVERVQVPLIQVDTS